MTIDLNTGKVPLIAAGYGSETNTRAWCNGSIRVSKTFDLGSNPSARAKYIDGGKLKMESCFLLFQFPISIINYIIIMNKFSAYVRDSYKELVEKVTWPAWDQLQQSTMIVLGTTLIITLIVMLMDFVSNNGMKLIYSLFN